MAMRRFQVKVWLRRLTASRLVVFLLLLLVVWLARPAFRIWQRRGLVRAEERRVAAQLAELGARKIQLEKEIARLKTPRGVEGEIRKKFPVVKAGERVLIVVEDEATSTPAVVSASWWERLQNLFD